MKIIKQRVFKHKRFPRKVKKQMKKLITIQLINTNQNG